MSLTRSLFLRLPPYFGYVLHHPHDVTLPFTTGYVASIIKKTGREAAVLDAWANGWTLVKVLKYVRDFQPDFIFFDSTTGVIPAIQECGHNVKKMLFVKIIIFGTVPTFFPEVLFNEESRFDVGMTGECEDTAVELLDALEQNKGLENVAGLVYWRSDVSQIKKTSLRPLRQDLDQLPFIDYSLFDLKYYRKFSFPIPLFRPVRWGHVLATRGCPYNCSFCSHDHRQSYGKEFRRASANRVVDEFEILASEYAINAISIEDDCFTLDRDHVITICDEMERRNLNVKWVVQTRADLLDKALMIRMKQAGCVGFSLGLESGSDRILKLLKKGITRAQSEQVIHNAAKEGLMLRLLFMIGNPTETREEINETLDLALKAQAITIQVHFCTPYPGTSFFGQEEGDFKHLENYSSYNAIHRNMSLVPDNELRELRNSFYHKYYFSWHYFKLFLRQRLLYLAGQAANDVPLILRAFWYMIRGTPASKKRALSKIRKKRFIDE